MKNNPSLLTLMLYAKEPEKLAYFYQQYFDFNWNGQVIDGLIELDQPKIGMQILIHQAAKSIKTGKTSIKLVFSVADVDAFKQSCLEKGLVFGATHEANHYQFANAKDIEGNAISISSRIYRKQDDVASPSIE